MGNPLFADAALTARRLTVGGDGRVTGPASLTYNTPWPCVNGAWGSGAMMGILMHTQVGNNPGTVSWFNNPQAQASAHFCIAQDGSVVQMGPIGKGWIAWHAAAANLTWYGIEHADDGNPANPLTPAQITASAQIVECLSAFAGFPLQISNSPSTKGYGWHGMGGAAFGGHYDCPGDVRKAQRPQIIALAMAIRSTSPPPAPDWTETMIANLPDLHPGDTDHPGATQFVHRMQALIAVIGGINHLPAAAAVAADGNFGPATGEGLAAVQHMFGVPFDPACRQPTWAALVAGTRP